MRNKGKERLAAEIRAEIVNGEESVATLRRRIAELTDEPDFEDYPEIVAQVARLEASASATERKIAEARALIGWFK